jgi:hypothetical protein
MEINNEVYMCTIELSTSVHSSVWDRFQQRLDCVMQPQILLCLRACVSVIVTGKLKKIANGVLYDVEHKLHIGSFPGKISCGFTVHALI